MQHAPATSILCTCTTTSATYRHIDYRSMQHAEADSFSTDQCARDNIRARKLKGPHSKTIQPTRLRNTPLINQSLAAHDLPTNRKKPCKLTTNHPVPENPPGSVPDERRHPGVGRTFGSVKLGQPPIFLNFGRKNPRALPKAVHKVSMYSSARNHPCRTV